MKQPLEPNKEDCCNSGCNPCIFDVYEQQLRAYEKYLECSETPNEPEDNGISQLEYTPFVLQKSLQICKSHKLLVFKRLQEIKKVWWKPGDHFLFKFTSEDLSCTRAYTPLRYGNQCNDNDFCIIIKVYNNGLVSKHLGDLVTGDCTLWRGPYGCFEIVPNKFDRVIMIAQGTGIAPFVSIIENILNNEDDMARIMLFYCCQNEDQILLRDDLYEKKSYWNFMYNVYLSNTADDACLKFQEPVVHRKLCVSDLAVLEPFSLSDQFLLCGSTEFMEVYHSYLKHADPLLNVIMF